MSLMYKVYIESRYFLISSQPDRTQNYCLFHKFHDRNALYKQISEFIESDTASCINIYSYEVDHLWDVFAEYFHLVEAAGGIVTDSSGRMLLIRRNSHWDAPKGHFEPHETPEDCARREIEEECGICSGENVSVLSPSYHIYRHSGEYYLKKTYWFIFSYSGDLSTIPQLEEGITEARWISNTELFTLGKEMWSSIRDVINEAQRKLGNYL